MDPINPYKYGYVYEYITIMLLLVFSFVLDGKDTELLVKYIYDLS